jgi:hypothetical protein
MSVCLSLYDVDCFVTLSLSLSFSSLSSLGAMQFSWENDLSSSLRLSLEKQLIASLSKEAVPSPVQLSAAVKGLVDLKYPWNRRSEVEKAIFEGIKANYHFASGEKEMKEKEKNEHREGRGEEKGRELSNILYSLGELSKAMKSEEGLGVCHLPDDIRKSFWNGISQKGYSFSPSELVNVVYGLNSLNFKFNDLPFEVSSKLKQSLLSHSERMNEHDVGSLVYR